MSATLAALPRGHEFPPTSFTLSPEWVDAYIEAVGDAAIRNACPGLVPPMAVAALSIRAMIEASPLPPGTLHAGQELAFRRAVRIGEQLTVGARVVSRGERGGWVLLSVDFGVSSVGEDLMNGRATVTFPMES
jgi:acyl dehydratase